MRCASFKPFWPTAPAQQALAAIVVAALRRFRGAALFRGLRPSSRLGAPFWPSGLTVRRSRPPAAAAELGALDRIMSEATAGLLVLFFITSVSAFVWFKFMKSFLLATLLSTGTSVLLFQAVAYLHAGYLDPFFPIVIITSSVVCLFITLVVGMFLHARSKDDDSVF